MRQNGIRIRSFSSGQFFEIELPNGKHILLDPFWGWSREGLEGHDPDEILGADYILLTHTHGDHDIDLGFYAHKYNSKVIAPLMSARAIWKYHKITSDQIFFAVPGGHLDFDDFTVEFFPAKHICIGDVYDPDFDISFKLHQIQGHKECDEWGSMDSCDFLITTREGMRIAIVSGRTILQNTIFACQKAAPDVLIRQVGLSREGSKELIDPNEFANHLARFRTKYVFPMHYDSLQKKLGSEQSLQQFYRSVSYALKEHSCSTFQCLKPWTWYSVTLSVDEC